MQGKQKSIMNTHIPIIQRQQPPPFGQSSPIHIPPPSSFGSATPHVGS